MVVADDVRFSIEGHIRIYSGIIKKTEVMGIRQAWRKEGGGKMG